MVEHMILSTDSIDKDYTSTWYRKWMLRLGANPNVRHAKFWEQAMIYGALKQNGMLKPGKKGLGFGVGVEHLVSVFANEGVDITATDQAPENAQEWDNGQLSHGKKSLYYKSIIDKKDFEKRVDFRYHDMNVLEKSFVGKYDFVWSNCVIGHLGSMKLSEKHLKRHAKYIKDGGISVLTTELVVSSLTETVTANSGTIVWRLSDLLRVFNEMLDNDMVANRMRLRFATSPQDYNIYYTDGGLNIKDVIDGTATLDEPMEKIGFSNWAITQLQIIFKKRRLSKLQKSFYRLVYWYDYQVNTMKLKRFMNHDGDIADYRTRYETADLEVMPNKKAHRITTKPGSTVSVTVRYKNNSTKPLFAYGLHMPLHVPPILLANASPVNSDSKLHTKSWFSKNRVAAEFKGDSHKVSPGGSFEYTFNVKAPRAKGIHSEDFCLVLEGVGDIPRSRISLQLTVK